LLKSNQISVKSYLFEKQLNIGIMKKLTLLLFILITSYSCKEDIPDPLPSSEEITADEIAIVTGIKLRYPDGDNLFTIGNPNVKNEGIFMSPVPAKDFLKVGSATKIDEIWILPAKKVDDQFETNDFVSLLKDKDYDMANSGATLLFSASNIISNKNINLDQYENGYYRIFVRPVPDGKVFWDNIYIDKDNDYDEAATLLREDWGYSSSTE